MRPHRRQPIRLLRPWDSPGKNTGVGCHFLLQCMKVKSEREVTQSCLTLRDPMDRSPPGSSVHGIFQARVLEWGAIAFSTSVSMSTLIILIFFAPLHIPQPKPHDRRSKLERWCWERATHKHTLMSQHRLWVPNKWWVWAIQIKNVNMQCLEVYWPNW